MANVYKLRYDRLNYMVFEVPAEERIAKLGDIFALNSPVWSDFWKPLEGRFYDESDKKNVIAVPDITCWFTDNLVLNDKAHDLIGKELAPYGEMLPATCEGNPYWILHVTKLTDMDAIDMENSERTVEDDGYVDMQSLAFKYDAIKDLLIFKTEYSGYKNIYCTDTFKNLVEDAGLKGIVFSTDLVSLI